MSRYRYTRSNGQFLPSQFINPVAESTDRSFRGDQAYDLKKDFISGSDASVNSFVTDTKSTGYTAKGNLVAWWRPGQRDNDSGSSVNDSSENLITLTPPSAGATPSLDSDDTPGQYISYNSLLFDGNDSLNSDVASNLNFGDGTYDKPFSVSAWLKPSSATTMVLMSKGPISTASNDRQWTITMHNSMKVSLKLTDGSTTRGRGKMTTNAVLSVDDWYHLVVTYDGRGGDSCNEGISIYVNGTPITSLSSTADGSGVYTAMEPTDTGFALGSYIGATSGGWKGNIADTAVWSKVLSATDIVHLYGVPTAGAYRLVRDFEQVSPDNDTRVLGIATGKRGFDVSSWPTDVMNQFVQGVNVVSFKQLLNYTTSRIRPNSSFIKTFRGRDLPRTAFDDSIATTSFSSGSNISHVSIGGDGRLSERLTHEREQRDLGQSVVYDDGEPFEDTLDLDPPTIVAKHPVDLILPSQLVAQTSNELTDGVIEPLIIREKIDMSSIEGPFYSHDVRASLGGMIDAFRRSYVIVDGWDLDEPDKGTAPFLDSVENMGDIDLPGAFSDDFAKIEPYVDYANDRDKEYTTNNVETTISTTLVSGSTWVDNDVRTYDKMAAHGFVFDGDTVGIDSIAYGGLKK